MRTELSLWVKNVRKFYKIKVNRLKQLYETSYNFRGFTHLFGQILVYGLLIEFCDFYFLDKSFDILGLIAYGILWYILTDELREKLKDLHRGVVE